MANRNRFNDQQWEAIVAPVDEDILISAGAGSGKTNTLSERVCEIILGDKVKPSELLVLTFTNNAAHEMKERILAKFPKEEKDKANQLLSSHIQTFDSLYQYLVSQYSMRLGIADKLNVLDDNIAKTKRSEIVEQIFTEYYENPAKSSSLISFIQKIDMKGDRAAKRNVLSLWEKLDALGKIDKEVFLSTYDERFYSLSFAQELYHAYLSSFRQSLIDTIYEAAFAEYHYELYIDPFSCFPSAKEAFSSVGFWGKSYDSFSFKEENYAEPLYEAIVDLIKSDDETFVSKVKTFREDYASLLTSRTKGLDKEEKERLEKPWKILKSAVTTEKRLTKPIETLGSFSHEYEKILKTKDDVHLLMSLVKDADERFYEFKKVTNSFSFSDIADLALSLLTDSAYADIASEIRSRFAYIMVDEYQDTNPAQEAFLESLLKPNDSGKRAHLFVVGDAKQSIYLFRGSVVALFRERQKRYLSGLGHKVIAMNYNYRSGKRLLDDINYICSYYMRLNHGSIDYKNDSLEHLSYDSKVNLYRLPYEHFGVSRIITPNLPLTEMKMNAKGHNEAEAFAILTDIKKKLAEGYPVYDRSVGIRPCRPSDFAILMRVKSRFGLYEKLFSQNGVKLNKVIATNLREANAVILVESLIKMIKWMTCGGKEDPKHLFASIARSYAYEYSDTRLYELLRVNDASDSLSTIKSDPLWKELENFVSRNSNASFHDIYLGIINEFHVIDKLYKIGDIEDNISKIESLYELVLSNESTGSGIESFVNLFANMNRYSLEFSADTLTRNDDAVDMMTIHASKGLERKIVYMPVSLNAMPSGDHRNAPDFVFSKDKGIGFPDYSFDPPISSSFPPDYETSYETLLTRSYSSKDSNPEVDDHVRLFYVALTRAENQVIIVGDDDKKAENLYAMLNQMPSHYQLNDAFIEKKIQEGVIDKADYEAFLSLSETMQGISLPLLDSSSISREAKETYLRLGKAYYLDIPLILQKNYLLSFARDLYLDYEKRLCQEKDLDLYTRVFVSSCFPSLMEKYQVNSFSSFLNALAEERKKDLLDEISYGNGLDDSYNVIEEDGELPSKDDENFSLSEVSSFSAEEWEEKIREFISELVNEDTKALQIPAKSDNEEDDKEEIIVALTKTFLPSLMKAFDGATYLTYLSYESKDYRDEVSFMSDYFQGEVTSKLPQLIEPKVNDDTLAFIPRIKKRASKVISLVDEEVPSNAVLEKGIHLHRLLELTDIASGDTSFILDKADRESIDKVLSLPIMRLAKKGEIHSEYGYYDRLSHSTGFIDLLFKLGEDYYIVDYKTSHIDDPLYVDQLHAYKENIVRIFGCEEKRVHMYLVSILQGKQKEIA